MLRTRIIAALGWLTLVPLLAIAQDPVLSGIVIDERTGEPIRGARIAVSPGGWSTRSDLSGNFAIPLPAGEYQVSIESTGYALQRLAIVMEAGADNNIGVVLGPAPEAAEEVAGSEVAEPVEIVAADPAEPEAASATTFAQSVTVTASAIQATEEALLVERRMADEIQDSIGRSEMSKLAASDGASVMKRVTGVSLVDDKYVYVRGLGERYSNTTLNGTAIPTTEPEKRVVPLDLFSAGLLDKITVLKSYTPDKAGEFAAGFVELETLDFPTRSTLSVGLGASWYADTTGDSVELYAGGLSFDGSGGHGLPAAIPNRRVVKKGLIGDGFTPQELERLGEAFVREWEPTRGTADPNPSFSLTFGDTFGKLGVVVSATQGESTDRTLAHENYFKIGGDRILPNHAYDFDTTEQKLRRGLVGNVSFRLDDSHQVKLRSLLTDTSSSEVRRFEGFNADANNGVRDTRLRYQNESILAVQLSGDHFFGGLGSAGGTLVEWKVAPSRGERNENLRETLYEEIEPGVFQLADESQSGFLLYNDLTDEVVDQGIDVTSFFTGRRLTGSVKFGAALTRREREFDSRRFRFVPQRRMSIDYTLPPDELFSDALIDPRGFELSEETRPTDSYDASHEVAGSYLMADASLGRWRVIAGLRFEASDQEVVTADLFDPNADPIVTINDETDLLPAFNLVYRLGERQNLRAAFSRTVNRPEFRELAPFEFTDVVGGRATLGNPALTRALITSWDLRWEWFPSAGEVVAASLFYKHLDDPIERVVRPTAQLSTSFANADAAENFGLEIEMRRNLGFLSPSLASWTAVTNYTWVDSSIELGPEGNAINTSTERPLAGQSDHVLNLSLEWAPAGRGSVVRALYNFTGDKISDVGAQGLPDLVETARNTLDVVWLQDLPFVRPGVRLKASFENLLDEDRIFEQGGLEQARYGSGREFSLGLSVNVF